MGKRRGWLWVLGALTVGWFVGNSQPDRELSTNLDVQQVKTEPTTVLAPSVLPNLDRPKTKPPKSVMTASIPEVKQLVSPPKIVQVKPDPPEPVAKRMYVDASRLNVRNQPDRSGKRVWTLKRDEGVNVTAKNGEWLFVKGSRYEGWVFGTYLTPNKAANLPNSIASRPATSKPKVSVSKIKKTLIRRSLALYSGNCPCPYNRTKRGRKCGGRSAYSRPGGASPLCYASDITKQMVSDYRSRL